MRCVRVKKKMYPRTIYYRGVCLKSPPPPRRGSEISIWKNFIRHSWEADWWQEIGHHVFIHALLYTFYSWLSMDHVGHVLMYDVLRVNESIWLSKNIFKNRNIEVSKINFLLSLHPPARQYSTGILSKIRGIIWNKNFVTYKHV